MGAKGGTRLTCVVEGVEHGCLPKVELPEGHGGEVGALGLAGPQQAPPRPLLGAAGRAALGALAAHVHCPQSPPRPAPALASSPLALGRPLGLQRPRRPRRALVPRRQRAPCGLGRRPERPSRGSPAAALHAAALRALPCPTSARAAGGCGTCSCDAGRELGDPAPAGGPATGRRRRPSAARRSSRPAAPERPLKAREGGAGAGDVRASGGRGEVWEGRRGRSPQGAPCRLPRTAP